jgi:molybdate transport system substrate-binding protein
MRKQWKTKMRSKRISYALTVAGLLFNALTASAADSPKEILISAAASLKDVMGAITLQFEKANPTEKLTFNFGSSGQLKMQIESGASVDVFVSASSADMDVLANKGLVEVATRSNAAKNSLVLIRNKDKSPQIAKTEDLLEARVNRIAIGNPTTVPAGRYAKETLEKRGVYEKLTKKLVMAENVRQVLDYVARGEVDAGYVYKTDSMIEPMVMIVETVPADQHKPIVYPAAVLKGGKNQAGAKKFVEYLRTKEALAVFKTHGFE